MNRCAAALVPLILLLQCAAAPVGGGIRIPAGRLADTLRAIGLGTGDSVIFGPDLVAGRRAPALQLEGPTETILRRLLAGSGLRFRTIAPHLFVIERTPPTSATPSFPVGATGADDIVVTAMRRPTLLADTPLSMVALTGADLARAGATGLADVAAIAPSLMVSSLGPGLNRLSLRGVFAAGEATVGLYYGDVPVAGPGGTTADPSLMTPDLALVDIDRIEVLRGPQGTLYGAGSLAGTVRVLFRTPDPDRFEEIATATASVTQGGDPDWTISGVANLPLQKDRLALRIVAYRFRTGGIIDNRTLGLRNVDVTTQTGGRIALRWLPGDGWSIDLSGAYQRTIQSDSSLGQIAAGFDGTLHPVRMPFDDHFLLASAAAKGKLGGVTLDATLAHSRWTPQRSVDVTQIEQAARDDPEACARYFGLGPVSCSPTQSTGFAAYVDTQIPAVLEQPLFVTVDSAETRLSGGTRLVWTAGFFYSARHDGGTSSTLPVLPATGLPPPNIPATAQRSFNDTLNQSAAFVDAKWRLDQHVSLSGGLRYFRYSRDASGITAVSNLITGPAGPSPFARFYSAQGIVGRERVEVRSTGSLLVYAQVSSGFRPGGINVVPGLDPSLAVYRDDRLISYEIGGRAQFDSGRLSLNAAAYAMYWSDMQWNATSRNGAYAFITNIGDARIHGGELEVSWRPLRAVEARLDATITDSRLASGEAGSIVIAGEKGDRLPLVAPIALSASLAVDEPLTDGPHLLADLHIHYVGRSWSTFEASDPDRLSVGDYATVDLDIGVASGPVEARLFVRNVGDSHGRATASSTAFGIGDVQWVRPRTMGISLQRTF